MSRKSLITKLAVSAGLLAVGGVGGYYLRDANSLKLQGRIIGESVRGNVYTFIIPSPNDENANIYIDNQFSDLTKTPYPETNAQDFDRLLDRGDYITFIVPQEQIHNVGEYHISRKHIVNLKKAK